MANTNIRRKLPAKPARSSATPWSKGDPTKKFGLNTPIAEPLMIMLDFMVEHRLISSKASFIREVVERAAEEEINKYNRVQEAVRRMDAGKK